MRELVSYQIVVEQTEAKRALADVDRGFKQVDDAATRAGRAIDTSVAATARAAKEAERAAAQSSRLTEGVARDVEASSRRIDALLKEQDRDRQARAKAHAEQVKQETKAIEQQARESESTLAALGRKVVAAFAIERVVSFGAQVVKTAGHIQDLSDQTGIGTTALQRLGYAATLSGSNVESVASAIGTMSRNLVGGNGGAVGALQQLGLSHQALMQMRPEDAFLAIADAVRAIKDPMVQADTWSRIFGKGALELLPAVKSGFRELGEEAERTGAVMSEQTVRDLDTLGDAWTRVWAGMEGWTGRVLAALFRTKDLLGTMWSGVPEWVKTAASYGSTFSAANIFSYGLGLSERYGATTTPATTSALSPMAPMASHGLPEMRMLASHGSASAADPVVIQSRERLATATTGAAQSTRDLVSANEAYLRSIINPVIGVNHNLLSAEQQMFNQRGVVGTNPGYGDFSALSMQGLIPSRSYDAWSTAVAPGFSGGASAAGTGGGWWNSAAGRGVGAGIGIAGGAAMGAMAGGDPYASMVGGAASAVSGAMLAGAGMSTVALGAATMGIGAAAVGVYMLAKHFTTVSKEVKQARVDIAEFQAELWKTATTSQMAEAAGQDWAATTIVVRDAYARMGKTAAEAEQDVRALWDDRHPDAARAAMQRITTVVDSLQRALAKANEEMATLLGQASDLATRLPQDLLDQLQSLVDKGDLTGQNASLVAALQGAPAINYAAVESRAAHYGIDRDALGQGFNQYKTNTVAQQLIDDVALFTESGVGMGTVLHGMREEISALVQESLKFGTTLPENMKPWIEELKTAGLLVDENGEKLTDLTQIQWGESLATSTQRLIDAIRELIDTLNGPLTQALDTIGSKVVTPTIDLSVEGSEDLKPIYRAHGGVVYAASGFIPRGTDTVPAMLTPGEGVLSRRGMAMLGALNDGTTGAGRGLDYDQLAEAVARALRAAPPVIAMDGRTVSDQITPHVGASLRYAGAWR